MAGAQVKAPAQLFKPSLLSFAVELFQHEAGCNVAAAPGHFSWQVTKK